MSRNRLLGASPGFFCLETELGQEAHEKAQECKTD